MLITLSLEKIYVKELSNCTRLEYLNPLPTIRTQYLCQGNSFVYARGSMVHSILGIVVCLILSHFGDIVALGKFCILSQ